MTKQLSNVCYTNQKNPKQPRKESFGVFLIFSVYLIEDGLLGAIKLAQP